MGKHARDNGNGGKYAALIVIGILTLFYSLAEVTAALYYSSLTLLSDGFHNLSDVIALIIAFWALKKAEQGPTKMMTYGWKRTEILGAVMNGCFLLALCLYTILETIPRFFEPRDQFDHSEHGHDDALPLPFAYIFIIISSSGLAINLAGTIAFAIVGANAHGHSHDGAHGHGHGGDDEHHSHSDHEDHGHSHEHKEKKEKKEKDGGHGHSHEEKKAKKVKENNHGHSHGDAAVTGEEGHSHEKKDKSKKKDKGHGHSHDDHAHDHDEHDHGHNDDHHSHDSEEEHGHSHGDNKVKTKPIIVDESIGINTSSSASSYQYGEATFLTSDKGGEKELLLVASGSKKPKKHEGKTDHNIRAVFLHYLGDALSSVCVLATGLLYHFFPHANWTKYLDPISSLVIVALILVTTIPFVKSASVILLQRVPNEVSIPHLTEKLLRVDGVLDVHDLHVWQLVDKMIIASVHVRIETTDIDRCKRIMANAKAVFHRFGVHSCTMQPEFMAKGFITGPRPCSENCVDDCVEDWCCKAEEEILEVRQEYGSLLV